MIRIGYRTGPRTAVSAGPVAAALVCVGLILVALALAWRAAVALVVIGACVGLYRLVRRSRRG